ncbi:MAG: alkaline phosphatase [Acidobacteriota bacterium]
MRARRRACCIVVVTLVLAAGGCREPAGPAAPAAASAVLFIADGMGPGYTAVTRVALGGSGGRLRLDGLPNTALLRTHAADAPVTDSAAAASAMACGRKAPNGVICQDASAVFGRRDGKRLESVALWAARRGLRVGVLTTTRVTDATAAAFYATHNDRSREREIARQAIASPLDFLLGGGRAAFRPEGGEEVAWSGDDREDLERSARRRGWRVVHTSRELGSIASLQRPVLGLFAAGPLPYEVPGDGAGAAGGGRSREAPTLEEMTVWAIDRLAGTGEPFLLVIEAGRIDHAGHRNWARTAVAETAALDRAVGEAVDRLDPETTLLLVTADHETGGLVLNGYASEAEGIWTTYHPVDGGGSYPVLTFATGPSGAGGERSGPSGPDDARPAGFGAESAAHTGTDVVLYGWGKSSELVRGTLENTAVYWLLRAHLEGRTPERSLLTRAPP